MTTSANPHVHRRFHDDDGAVVVEFALILPFLVLVILGLIEYGYLFRQESLFSGAVQSAARIDSHTLSGATAATKRPADQFALQAIMTQFTSLKNVSLTRVIIYKAAASDGAVPGTCLAITGSSGGGVNGSCNVFNSQQPLVAALATAGTAPASGFMATCTGSTGGDLDRYWCPTDRISDISSSPDWVGVYVEARYTYLTKVFGPSRTITDRAVFRAEVSLG